MDDTAELIDIIAAAFDDEEMDCQCLECCEAKAVVAVGQIQSKFRISRIENTETFTAPSHPMGCQCEVCQ